MLQASERAGNLVLRCQLKRLDASQANSFRQQFEELSEQASGRVILDLSAVEFIDSTGLGAIVACMKGRAGRGELVLTGLDGAVAELFRLTRLDGVFPIFETVDDALG